MGKWMAFCAFWGWFLWRESPQFAEECRTRYEKDKRRRLQIREMQGCKALESGKTKEKKNS
jgi:hypothetical protein